MMCRVQIHFRKICENVLNNMANGGKDSFIMLSCNWTTRNTYVYHKPNVYHLFVKCISHMITLGGLKLINMDGPSRCLM